MWTGLGLGLRTSTRGGGGVTFTYPSVLDADTIGMYLPDIEGQVTYDESNRVSLLKDYFEVNDLVQTEGAQMPTYNNGVLEFDGIADNIKKTVAFNQPFSLYVIFSNTYYGAYKTIVDFANGGAILGIEGSATRIYTFAGAVLINPNYVDQTFDLAVSEYNGAAGKSFLEGGDTVGNVGTANATGICLGARSGGAAPAQCKIKAVIIRSKIDSQTDREEIETFLRERYL